MVQWYLRWVVPFRDPSQGDLPATREQPRHRTGNPEYNIPDTLQLKEFSKKVRRWSGPTNPVRMIGEYSAE